MSTFVFRQSETLQGVSTGRGPRVCKNIREGEYTPDLDLRV